MRIRRAGVQGVIVPTLLLAAISDLPASGQTPSVSCESLGALKPLHTTVTRAQGVRAGAFTGPAGRGSDREAVFKSLPAFCRVEATIRPVTDSEINIEVWLPVSGWNGKLQSVGNGAWAGTINYPGLSTAVAGDYAAAATDTGHSGNTGSFAIGHPEKVVDFAYRSVHEMTVAAKAIITAFYGNPARYSYWNGCSIGGRQALAEAQRYPNDYEGILAGAPANYVTHLQGQQVWAAQQAHLSEASVIPPAKLAALHEAALAACDALDGVKDGVIEDPTRCHFDPKVLLCKANDGPSCLTAPQMELALKLYAGPRVPTTGKQIFPGLEPGSEIGWSSLAGREPMALAVETYQYLVHQDARWNYQTFELEKDIALADRTLAATMNSTNPHLDRFFEHGGKLLLYHGWADPGIAPENSVNYYTSVIELAGADAADSIRLFMVPGMGHCRGGDGTDTFDGIGALDQWVASGKAPDQIVASRVRKGVIDRSRPLCPYPQVARYKGAGSTDDASHFACGAPQ
jgi:feruloyl esterase